MLVWSAVTMQAPSYQTALQMLGSKEIIIIIIIIVITSLDYPAVRVYASVVL